MFISGVAVSVFAPIVLVNTKLVYVDGFKLFILLGVPASLIAAYLTRRLPSDLDVIQRSPKCTAL